MIDRAQLKPAGSSVPRTTANSIGNRLQKIVDADPDSSRAFRTLVAGMKWNSESKMLLGSIDEAVAWQLLLGNEVDVPPDYRQSWHEIDSSAKTAAFEYAGINLALRWTDLISLFFPESIRMTVHPKPNQFALARVGGAYPWNGVAWSAKWPKSMNDVATRPFYTLAEQRRVTRVIFESSGSTCFYTGDHRDR